LNENGRSNRHAAYSKANQLTHQFQLIELRLLAMMSLEDVESARRRIRALIKKTPLLRSGFLSDLTGGEVCLKLENLQITSSFKIRGALNRMLNLTAEDKQSGVITASTGNHAQAVAYSAAKLNVPARIVVPRTAPKVKVEKIRKHKVELILHGEDYDQAEQYAIELSKKEALTYISPYNDAMVIAGQGTIGLEILEEIPTVDTIIVPVSGGGLVGGIALAAKETRTAIKIQGVQPEATPAMYESLKAGRIINVEMRPTVADALDGNMEKGSLTFDLAQRYVDEVLLIKEDTIREAIKLLWERERQVAEGGGAIAIAPILEKRNRYASKTTVAVISGGNIDAPLFQSITSERLPSPIEN